MSHREISIRNQRSPEDSKVHDESHISRANPGTVGDHFLWHMPPWREETCQDARLRGSQARAILVGYPEESCHCEGAQTLPPPQAVGTPPLGRFRTQEDKSLRNLITMGVAPALRAGVLDQINSSSNLKYSVILWIPVSLNKNRPEDCTASIPGESHWGISEGCGISSFIWGTS